MEGVDAMTKLLTITAPTVRAVHLSVPPFWTPRSEIQEWVGHRHLMSDSSFGKALHVLCRASCVCRNRLGEYKLNLT